jgi:hypothetical protein
METFLNIIVIIIIGYIIVWITLFLHEFAHAFFGWLFGVCRSPVSIGYLSLIKLPMTPLIEEIEMNKLSKSKQLLIHSGGLLMNLFLLISASLLLLNNTSIFTEYSRMFILLFIVSNFAELESYITFGAIRPISDVKFILELINQQRWSIYIPGILMLIIGVCLLYTSLLQKNEYGYFIYFIAFYGIACSS